LCFERATIEGMTVMFDSGASTSLMTRVVYKKLEPSTVTISTANKNSEAMLITINGTTIPKTRQIIAEANYEIRLTSSLEKNRRLPSQGGPPYLVFSQKGVFRCRQKRNLAKTRILRAP
jgi:hypothetical protein